MRFWFNSSSIQFYPIKYPYYQISLRQLFETNSINCWKKWVYREISSKRILWKSLRLCRTNGNTYTHNQQCSIFRRSRYYVTRLRKCFRDCKLQPSDRVNQIPSCTGWRHNPYIIFVFRLQHSDSHWLFYDFTDQSSKRHFTS